MTCSRVGHRRQRSIIGIICRFLLPLLLLLFFLLHFFLLFFDFSPFVAIDMLTALLLLLAQLLPESVDLPTEQPNALGSAAAGAHGRHHVQLVQQSLELIVGGQVQPVVWVQQRVHCSEIQRESLVKCLSCFQAITSLRLKLNLPTLN